jgi:hypothetical protein
VRILAKGHMALLRARHTFSLARGCGVVQVLPMPSSPGHAYSGGEGRTTAEQLAGGPQGGLREKMGVGVATGEEELPSGRRVDGEAAADGEVVEARRGEADAHERVVVRAAREGSRQPHMGNCGGVGDPPGGGKKRAVSPQRGARRFLASRCEGRCHFLM